MTCPSRAPDVSPPAGMELEVARTHPRYRHLFTGPPPAKCELDAGHDGPHRNGGLVWHSPPILFVGGVAMGGGQLDVFGGETPAEELDWPASLRLLADRERELGSPLTADEAGAVLHERRGKHSAGERCRFCTVDGEEALARLLDRRPLEEAAASGEQTRSPRLADTRPADASSSGSVGQHARARSSDPETSHAAAASIPAGQLRDSQEAILRLFRELGPMSDDLLVERYQAAVLEGLRPDQSPSGIRTRRHELVEQSALRDSGYVVTLESGRKAIVWELASSPLAEYDPEPEL